jgi:hypothetical protein
MTATVETAAVRRTQGRPDSNPAPAAVALDIADELYYVVQHGGHSDDNLDVPTFTVGTARVTKVTARRVYFMYGEGVPKYQREKPRILDRTILQGTGRDALPKHWNSCYLTLYVKREDAEAACQQHDRRHRYVKPKLDLQALRRAMADAHPDRGGTDEAFRAARQRDVTAKQRANRTGS